MSPRHHPRGRRSRRPAPIRTCHSTGKLRYPDEVAATVALVDLALKEKRGQQKPRGEQRPYRCVACGGWHLTSLPRA